jgi:hypothetical protein
LRGISSSDRLHGVERIVVLASWDIIKVSRFIADLVLRPSVSMISRIVRLNPAVAIRNGISSFRSWELLPSSDEGSSSGSGGGRSSTVGVREGGGIVVIEAKTFEGVGHVLVGYGTVDSAGVSSSDGLRSIIRILMLSGWDIIQISRLIADLVLRPGP